MFPELEKVYAPGEIEPRLAQRWLEGGWFHASADPADRRPTWSLVIPPPNVTGSLHMGHMLEHTQIDIVVRWRRMRGDNTLWLPGTDHAGIATQMVVERALAAAGQDRRAMGREAFVAAVWQWKQQSGERIQQQMIRLGASCDWSRARFTLDEGLSRAVREVFVRLYDEGLIYRGRYIVNWCPRCQTAVSDLEVTHTPVNGTLYRVRYAAADGAGALEVATTRPETILADVAVAVNPNDDRYRDWIGRQVAVPLTGRTVPVIADEIAQPDFGTGVVKITPGHDANDYAAGQRHGLPTLVVIDEQGRMTAAADRWAGLDRFAARTAFVTALEEAGLLAGRDEHALSLGRCQRCQTVVEPRISTQWFVRIAPLAQRAVEAVEAGYIRFVPAANRRVFFEWMAGIHDWCISRQLWWGHRIPAWYCTGCDRTVVAREEPAACPGCGGALRQDEDVLDTWFSSGLWPFSTLGWPEATADLAKFYPTSLLITGFDILFFWVARMIMLGVHCLEADGRSLAEAVPFREVYIHALVRDAERQKMSKTKGNVIDPLAVTERYGTDAVRFTLASMAAPGTDIALSEKRMEGYAAFANKIWNAARFIFLSLNRWDGGGEAALPPPAPTLALAGDDPVDRWLFSRLNAVIAATESSLAEYRFHEAAETLYHFIWHEYCDWYLELIKPRLHETRPPDEARRAAANLMTGWDALLRLLHPFMPFVTEEVWQALHRHQPPQPTIALAPFPAAAPALHDAAAERQIGRLQAIVNQIRSLRGEWRIGPRQRLRVAVRAHGSEAAADLGAQRQAIGELAGVETLTFVDALAAGGMGGATGPDFDLQIDLRGAIDVAAERSRLERERATLNQGIERADHQLGSASFRERAPAAVIAELERKKADLARQIEQLETNLAALATLE